MVKLKKTNVYYFSVEGETEKWYLDWLAETINNTDNSIVNVKIKSEVQKDPMKYVKKLKIISKTDVYHLFDYESNDQEHMINFHKTIDKLKEASSVKQIKYEFGYSNYTFDLWMILHKIDAFGSVADRKQYIKFINKAFSESFESMAEYKEENNFKRCLLKIDLSDVINAINRSITL